MSANTTQNGQPVQLVQMVTQVRLDQKRKLRLLSHQYESPMAEFIRQGIDHVIGQYPELEQDLPPAA